MKLKSYIISNLTKITPPVGFSWILINSSFNEYIIKWRNDKFNLQHFESQDKLSLHDQKNFLEKYNELDRIDLILYDKERKIPVGVFNIKNLTSYPEYGALIGNLDYRGIGLASKAKQSIFDFWFNIIDQKFIYVYNLVENTKVLKSNKKLGFEIIKTTANGVFMRLSKNAYYARKR